jgi:hypothetical protein
MAQGLPGRANVTISRISSQNPPGTKVRPTTQRSNHLVHVEGVHGEIQECILGHFSLNKRVQFWRIDSNPFGWIPVQGLWLTFLFFVRGVCRQRGFKQRPQLSSSQSFK